jgi:hypothetical protein
MFTTGARRFGDPMHVMMRQIMALFDEYQSKENAKHVLRALKESARQGFWNGSLAPIGYRVVAAEQRGAKVEKKLEIDPLHADTVRLIYRLALEGDGASGPMGVKNIASHPNAGRIFTRDGGRWTGGRGGTAYLNPQVIDLPAKKPLLRRFAVALIRSTGARPFREYQANALLAIWGRCRGPKTSSAIGGVELRPAPHQADRLPSLRLRVGLQGSTE